MLECVWAFAGGVGPVLGGTFTELVSWRWMWWINLPLSAATFVALLIFLDVHNPRTNVVDGLKAIDWLGTIGILGLTLMLLLGLDFGGDEFAWDSPRVICLIVFGCLMGVFFVCNEMKIATHPLMPLHIMKHQSNAATMVISFVHGFVRPPSLSASNTAVLLTLFCTGICYGRVLPSIVLPIGLTILTLQIRADASPNHLSRKHLRNPLWCDHAQDRALP